MSRYAADGSWNVTVVNGAALVGQIAADGSLNVIEATPGTRSGSHHACGAAYVINAESDWPLPAVSPEGALYVQESPYPNTTIQKVTVLTGSLSAPTTIANPNNHAPTDIRATWLGTATNKTWHSATYAAAAINALTDVFTVLGVDPDGDTLTYTITTQDPPDIFDITDDTLSLVDPGTDLDPGTFLVTVRATDPGSLYKDQQFTITVT